VGRKSSFNVTFRLSPIGAWAFMGFVYYYFLRPQMLKAGTLLGESQRRLPGDEIIASPGYQATRAIKIDAPPEAVWPWLVQMGRSQTGFYGIDRLTNDGQPSAAYLRNDLPALAKEVPLDNGARILDVEPNRMLLIGGFDMPTPLGEPMEQTQLFLLERQSDGSTRLLVRVRGYTYGTLGFLYNKVYEIIDYLNGSAQLNNLKQRAEMMAHLVTPVKA